MSNTMQNHVPEHIREKRLQSGALWTIYADRAVKILDSENINDWSFLRCQILNPGGSYWRWAKFLDIPKKNILIAIKWEQVSGPIRAIWDDWTHSWWPINESGGLHIDAYDKENHTLTVTWNHWANFTVEIPAIFTDNHTQYPYDKKLNQSYSNNQSNQILKNQLANFIKNSSN